MTKIQDVSLEELIDIKHGFAFKSDFFQSEPSDYILLTPGNFNVNQTLYFGRNTKYYLGDIPSGYVLDNGDLLVVMTDLTKEMNILGNAVILQSKNKVLHNQRIGKITIKDHQAIAKNYLMYVLNSDTVRKNIKATASGTTVRHTSPKKILELVIPLAPLLEQCRIAEVLGVWDESIDLLEKLIGRVRSRKQGLMQQLLTGKKRFKEFEGSDWKKVSLEKIAEINPRSHPNNLQFVGEFVEMASVSESGQLKNIAHIDLATSTSGYTAFINGDTLVAKITPCFENGKGALIEGLQGIGFGSTEFFVLRAKLEIVPIYLYYLTRTYDFGMRGKAMMQGSGGQQRVPSDFIRQFAVKLPSLPEQEKIASVLSAADEEISTLEKQLAAYKRQKLGLMQQLLTGKIRVGMV